MPSTTKSKTSTPVLHQVAIAVEDKKVSALDEHGHAAPAFVAQICRGKTSLLELKTILERLLAAGSKKRDAIPRGLLWRSEQRRVVLLQDEIKQVKSSLNVFCCVRPTRESSPFLCGKHVNSDGHGGEK